MPEHPFNLDRFLRAQSNGVFEQALEELQHGRKTSHWMWFIFPQHRDLGRSATAQYYGLSGVDEAAAYLRDPILGDRLRQTCRAILPHLRRETPDNILGHIDAMKLRSSMEIFIEASAGEPLFAEVFAAAS